MGEEIKLNRIRIAREYESGTLPAVDRERGDGSSDALTEKVRAYFAAALNKPVEQVGTETDFFVDEGGTSLDYFAMIDRMREEFSISFPAGEEAINTVKKLKEYIEERI